jgi:hypothetical protein
MVVAYFGDQPAKSLSEELQPLLTRLAELGLELEIRGEDGKPLGRFVPAAAKEPICPWEPDLTREDMERRIKEPGGMTLDEFWRKMGVK